MANAQVNFNLTNPHQTVAVPNAGSVNVVFTGTVDVTSGWDVTGANVTLPSLINSAPFLGGSFDPAFIAYVGGVTPGLDYSGNIFRITVTSTTPLGLYGFQSTTANPVQSTVTATNGTSTFVDNEAYSVNVVPEPATLAALGLGVAALVRRRRK
jgi:hypothetical protein